METAAAFRLRAAPKLVTGVGVVHLVEMTVAGLLMVFVILPAIFSFSLLSPQFWQIYTRFYVTGLFGTFFYVALALPLSAVIGFLMGWARVSRIRIFAWPSSLYVNVFRGVPPLILVIFASISGVDLVAKSRDLLGILPASGLPIVWIFAVWTVVALTYFVITYAVTRGLRLLERKFHTPGLEGISL